MNGSKDKQPRIERLVEREGLGWFSTATLGMGIRSRRLLEIGPSIGRAAISLPNAPVKKSIDVNVRVNPAF